MYEMENANIETSELKISFSENDTSHYGVTMQDDTLFISNFMICMFIWIRVLTKYGTPFSYYVENDPQYNIVMSKCVVIRLHIHSFNPLAAT